MRSVDALQPVYNVRTMEQVVSTALGERRTTALLITTFGVIALVLAAVGVYGVGTATVALLAVAILAALIPARRAALVDAAEAMRA